MKSFNSSPVVPTPSLGDYSNNVVTSKWVKDVAVAPIYLSPTGDDVNNDGLSSDSPVRSFSRALEISSELGQPAAKFVVEGGTYTENIKIWNLNITVYTKGTVTINGNILVENSAVLSLNPYGEKSSSKMFIINGQLKIVDFSALDVATALTVNSVDGSSNILIDYHSKCICYSDYDLTFGYTSTKPIYNIQVTYRSFFCGKNVKSINTASTACVSVSSHSSAILCGTNQLERNDNGGYLIDVYNGSCVSLTESSTNTFKHTGNNGLLISATQFALFTASNISSLLIEHTSTTGGTAISVGSGSLCGFPGGPTVTIQGSYTAVMDVFSGGIMNFSGAVSLSPGTGCTGKRYTVSTGGIIYSSWRGANLIPGSADGTTSYNGAYY